MASFLKNLFKSKWQHHDAAIRLEAITPELAHEALMSLASTDTEMDVRIKAIQHLSSLTEISGFISDKNKAVKAAAIDQYIATATGQTDKSLQIQSLPKLTEHHGNAVEILLTIASESSDQELAQAALNSVNEQTALFEFIMKANSAKARLTAAEKILDASLLKQIENHYKGKDKTLHRYAKNTIQQRIDAEAAIESAKQATASLLSQAEQLSAQPFSPTYEGQVAYLSQAWQKAEYTEASDSTFNEWMATCKKTLNEHKEQQLAINAENAQKAEALKRHNSVFNDMNSLFKVYKEKGVDSLESVTKNCSEFESAWLTANTIHPASSADKKDFDTAIDKIKSIINALSKLNECDAIFSKKANSLDAKVALKKSIQSLLNTITWPDEFQAPSGIKKLTQLSLEIDQDITSLKKDEQSHIDGTHTKLSDLESAIESGNLKQANKIQGDIKKSLALISKNHAKPLLSKLQVLSSELGNLQDWKGFAAEPKFVELCEKMEGLIDSDLAAKELSARINDLQTQWKALGSLGDKKQQDALWSRFKSASDTAYLPCKAYYDDLSNIRTFNLEQRNIICQQLENLFEQQNWSEANWKGIQKVIDKAFHEYKKFAPVDRAHNADIQKRFNDATQAIKLKLNAHYQSNIDAKQSIIDECSELIASEDLNAAIERCKALQQTWKTIESAGKSEQNLWTTFREKCDEIFERRKQESQAKRNHTNTLIHEAQTFVDQAKSLEASTERDSLKLLNQYKQSIRDLDIPEKVAAAKIHVIGAIEKTIQQNIERTSQQQAQQTWVVARSMSSDIANWELSSETDQEAIKTRIAQAELPKGVTEIFMARLQSTVITDLTALNSHCLDFEINMGIDSPSFEQQNRMALQIKRLQENMGKKQPTRQENIRTAQLKWFSYRASDNAYLEAQDRFFSAIKQSTEG